MGKQKLRLLYMYLMLYNTIIMIISDSLAGMGGGGGGGGLVGDTCYLLVYFVF